jgi:hypothetical protein
VNHLPSIDPETTSYGVILWLCSLTLTVISNAMPSLEPSWFDLILSTIAKISPLVSTFFLYIINKKAIDSYFRSIKRKIKK